ncbi:hypothetical protein HDU67_006218 [Dinochytrium kinnereticum]|nr:hypothetical protein HDU67_006218 [Dinochytrium kinnereticum]
MSTQISEPPVADKKPKERDDPTAAYDVRTLKNNDEVEKFLDHLGIVFGVPKTNGSPGAPRGVFQDHWENDPWKDLDGVAVAFAGEDVVSSVRVYVRKMHLGSGMTVDVGGIGDVATQIAHRGKRLASKLMSMGEDFMKAKNINFAVLHAAPAAAPLYASLGWKACGLGFYKVTIQAGELEHGKRRDARGLDLSKFEDVVVARSLFQTVAPNVAGTFARDDVRYWTRWVPACRDSRRRFVRKVLPGSRAGDTVAYMIMDAMVADLAVPSSAVSPLAVEVREFFAGQLEQDLPATPPAGWETTEAICSAHIPHTSPLPPLDFLDCFTSLLHSCIEDLGVSIPTSTIRATVPSGILPVESLEAMASAAAAATPSLTLPGWVTNVTRREDATDAYWMYKVLSPFSLEGGEEVRGEDGAVALMQRPVGRFAGCSGVVCERTLRGGFFRTDNF